jgi:ribosomal protein S18 acetylase RimI-like enzyme
MSSTLELQRIGAFLRDIEDRAAQRTMPVVGGVALFDDRVPNVWFANQIRLDGSSEMTAGEIAAEAERVQSAASHKHRRVTLHEPALGRRLAPGFRALGWEVDRLAVMVQGEPPEVPVDTRSVTELTDGGWQAFRRKMNADMDAETAQQMDDATQRLMASVGMRTFGFLVDGMVTSCCDLYSDGAIAQIESVATLEECRNRGYARAVVWRAIEVARAAGHELIFLVASADDWPRILYKRLGFHEIGYIFEFVRLPPKPD